MKLFQQKSLYPYWEIPKNKMLKEQAGKLRKAGNLAEVIFWQTFKDKKKFGFDIDRQVIIGNFIVDFFIPELGLVFEIDGKIHDFRKEIDKEREQLIKKYEIKIVRFSDEMVFNNIKEVGKNVVKVIAEREKELALKFPS